MLPITPSGMRRYIRYNATRKGLLGGSRLWLGVWAAGRARGFWGRFTKSGPAPLVYSGPVASGHWNEIVHEKPRPSASAVRAGRKTARKAQKAARRAESAPTGRNVRRAVRAQVRAASANDSLGPQRTAIEPMRIDRSRLSWLQRRALAKAGVKPLQPLEALDRKAIIDHP